MVKIIPGFPCIVPNIAWEFGAARAAVNGAHIGLPALAFEASWHDAGSHAAPLWEL
jgi:hypothetical protein